MHNPFKKWGSAVFVPGGIRTSRSPELSHLGEVQLRDDAKTLVASIHRASESR